MTKENGQKIGMVLKCISGKYLTNIKRYDIIQSHKIKENEDMTREERIVNLKILKSRITVFDEDDNKQVKALQETIKELEQEPTNVIATGDGAHYKIKALQESMRDATPKEQKSVNDYIKSISKPTRVEFDEEQEQLDFVQPHKQIPVTLTIESDAISREEVINLKWQGEASEEFLEGYASAIEDARVLPSVNPQPRTGHWIKYGKLYQCSECEELSCCQGKFCNECGAKMVEEQESEEV